MKFSLLALALLPAAYAAPAQPDAEQKNIMEAISKMTNELLLDTKSFAQLNGMLLEDMVSVPGILVKSEESDVDSHMDVEKRAWTNYIPLARSLTKHLLNGVGEVLTATGQADVAKLISKVTSIL